eukprot:PhF_6_TR10623/c0_g1_i2/m.17189
MLLEGIVLLIWSLCFSTLYEITESQCALGAMGPPSDFKMCMNCQVAALSRNGPCGFRGTCADGAAYCNCDLGFGGVSCLQRTGKPTYSLTTPSTLWMFSNHSKIFRIQRLEDPRFASAVSTLRFNIGTSPDTGFSTTTLIYTGNIYLHAATTGSKQMELLLDGAAYDRYSLTTIGMHTVYICGALTNTLTYGIGTPLPGIHVSTPFSTWDAVQNIQRIGSQTALFTLVNKTSFIFDFEKGEVLTFLTGFDGLLPSVAVNDKGEIHIVAYQSPLFQSIRSSGVNTFFQRGPSAPSDLVSATDYELPLGIEGIVAHTTPRYTVVLTSTWTLLFVGDATGGQLCTKTDNTNVWKTPAAVSLKGIESMVAQKDRAFFLIDKVVYGCGSNAGNLITTKSKADAVLASGTLTPVDYLENLKVRQITIGDEIGCAILMNSSLICWPESRLTCVMNDVLRVSVGTRHVTVQRIDGSIYTCGISCSNIKSSSYPLEMKFAVPSEVLQTWFIPTSIHASMSLTIVSYSPSSAMTGMTASQIMASSWIRFGVVPSSGKYPGSNANERFFLQFISGFSFLVIATLQGSFKASTRGDAFNSDESLSSNWLSRDFSERQFFVFSITYTSGIVRYIGMSSANILREEMSRTPSELLSFVHSTSNTMWVQDSLIHDDREVVWGLKGTQFPSNVQQISLMVTDGVCQVTTTHGCTGVLVSYTFDGRDILQPTLFDASNYKYSLSSQAHTGGSAMLLTVTGKQASMYFSSPEPAHLGLINLAFRYNPTPDMRFTLFGHPTQLSFLANRTGVAFQELFVDKCALTLTLLPGNWYVLQASFHYPALLMNMSITVSKNGIRRQVLCDVSQWFQEPTNRYIKGIVLDTQTVQSEYWIDDVLLCSQPTKFCVAFSQQTHTPTISETPSMSLSETNDETRTISVSSDITVSESPPRNRTKTTTFTPTDSQTQDRTMPKTRSRTRQFTKEIFTSTKTSSRTRSNSRTNTFGNMSYSTTPSKSTSFSETDEESITKTKTRSTPLYGSVELRLPLNVSVQTLATTGFGVTLSSISGRKWNLPVQWQPWQCSACVKQCTNDRKESFIYLESSISTTRNLLGINEMLCNSFKNDTMRPPVNILWNPSAPYDLTVFLGPWPQMRSRATETVTIYIGKYAFEGETRNNNSLSFPVKGADRGFLSDFGEAFKSVAAVATIASTAFRASTLTSTFSAPAVTLLSNFQCYSREAYPLDWTLSPFGWALVSSTGVEDQLIFVRGAMAGNITICIVAFVIHVIAVVSIKVAGSLSWKEAQGKAYFPGAFFVVHSFLHPGFVYSSAVLVFNGEYWAAILIVVYLAPVFAVLFYSVVDTAGLMANYEELNRLYGTFTDTPPGYWPHWRKYTDNLGHWVSFDTEGTYCDRYAHFFADLTLKGRTYMLTTTSFACALSIVCAFGPKGRFDCGAQVVIIGLFGFFHWAAILFFQPYSSKFRNHVAFGIAGLMFVSTILVVMNEWASSHDHEDIVDSAGSFFTITFMAITCCHFGFMFLHVHERIYQKEIDAVRNAELAFHNALEDALMRPRDEDDDEDDNNAQGNPFVFPAIASSPSDTASGASSPSLKSHRSPTTSLAYLPLDSPRKRTKAQERETKQILSNREVRVASLRDREMTTYAKKMVPEYQPPPWIKRDLSVVVSNKSSTHETSEVQSPSRVLEPKVPEKVMSHVPPPLSSESVYHNYAEYEKQREDEATFWMKLAVDAGYVEKKKDDHYLEVFRKKNAFNEM